MRGIICISACFKGSEDPFSAPSLSNPTNYAVHLKTLNFRNLASKSNTQHIMRRINTYSYSKLLWNLVGVG